MFDEKVQLTDLRFTDLFLEPFLNNGIMFDSFQSNGRPTMLFCSVMLDTCGSGVLICSTVSFSILGDMPSIPGDLFSVILLILLATTSGVMIQDTNQFIGNLVGWIVIYIIHKIIQA